jgi:hypothetical protein
MSRRPRFPILYGIVIALWIGAIVLGAVFEFWYVAIGAVVIHVLELPFAGIPIGRRAGEPLPRSVVMTLVFGFTWWLPILRRSRRRSGTTRSRSPSRRDTTHAP